MALLFNKIINLYKSYKCDREITKIKHQIHEMTYHLGRSIIELSPEFVKSLNIPIDTFKKEDNDLYMKYDLYSEMLIESEMKLSAAKKNHHEIISKNKDRIKRLKKEIKITKDSLKNATVKLKIRVKKDKQNKNKFRELTILKDSWDMNKTVKNLQSLTVSNKEKLQVLKEDLQEAEENYSKDTKKFNVEIEELKQHVLDNKDKCKQIKKDQLTFSQNIKKLHYKIGLKVLENNEKFPSLENQFIKIGKLYQMIEDLEVEMINY